MSGIRKELKARGAEWKNTELRELYDPAKQQGLGRKTEARREMIEQQQLHSASENRLASTQRRIRESPHAEQIEEELNRLQEFLEQNPQTPPEAVEEYLHSMFSQYFPKNTYGTKYNNAYCAQALAQMFYPDQEVKMRKVA